MSDFDSILEAMRLLSKTNNKMFIVVEYENGKKTGEHSFESLLKDSKLKNALKRKLGF